MARHEDLHDHATDASKLSGSLSGVGGSFDDVGDAPPGSTVRGADEQAGRV